MLLYQKRYTTEVIDPGQSRFRAFLASVAAVNRVPTAGGRTPALDGLFRIRRGKHSVASVIGFPSNMNERGTLPEFRAAGLPTDHRSRCTGTVRRRRSRRGRTYYASHLADWCGRPSSSDRVRADEGNDRISLERRARLRTVGGSNNRATVSA